MGPDEYQYPVNNSAYTNYVVKLALEFAGEAAEILGVAVPSDWATKVRVAPIFGGQSFSGLFAVAFNWSVHRPLVFILQL